MQKRALILGINGQDGSYLADLLVQDGYDVHGVVRRSSQPNLWRIAHLLDRITIHPGDLLDFESIRQVFWRILPGEVYNEADQDHVGYSFATPSYSAAVTYGAAANLLGMLGEVRSPKIRLFQPLSATMFGDASAPQTLATPLNPQSPYACAKAGLYSLCKHYRDKLGVFVSTAILYNHDSIRRQGDYLLHKICKSTARISAEDQLELNLSNTDMLVDVGHAEEYMIGARKLMQLDNSTDVLIGTGKPVTIKSLVDWAFQLVGVRPERFREVEGGMPLSYLTPDMSHTRELLNWTPSATAHDVVKTLCQHYVNRLGASQ